MTSIIERSSRGDLDRSSGEGRPKRPRTRSGMRRALRWVRSLLLLVPPLLLLAIVAGQIQQVRLARAYPAPGEMVQVGDHRMHVMRSGQGPTVVFENGPGGVALDWSLVAPQVDEYATTIAYDRAGLGWSEPADGPRDINTLVAELKRTLEAIEAPAPYVLVGHSYGGLIVRAYAYTYPEDVAGLVLVDAAHEDQFEFYPDEYAAKADGMSRMMARLRWVYRAVNGSGIPALFPSNFAAPIAAKLPEEIAVARTAAALMDSSQAVATTEEMAALSVSFDQVREVRKPLGNVPVRIITHGVAPGTEAGIPAGLEDEVEAAWQTMQESLLEISDDSSLRIAEGAGHDIMVENPTVVIEAINEIIER